MSRNGFGEGPAHSQIEPVVGQATSSFVKGIKGRACHSERVGRVGSPRCEEMSLAIMLVDQLTAKVMALEESLSQLQGENNELKG